MLEDCIACMSGVPGFKVFANVATGHVRGTRFTRCRSVGSASYGFHFAGPLLRK